MKIRNALLLIGFVVFLSACDQRPYNSHNARPVAGKYHFVDGYSAHSPNHNVNAVIEIPTGTVEKWEVDKDDGLLKWEIKNGDLRLVKYLGYPGNYGMIPQTLSPLEHGGDGDPLDVLVLGPPIKRGAVLDVKIIGVLKLLDNNETDDKLIAVSRGNSFYQVDTVEQLEEVFPGVLMIIETWFKNYKGTGNMTSSGFQNNLEAQSILNNATERYKESKREAARE